MKKAAMLSMIAVMIMAGSAFADLKEISNTAEFEKVIREATVPVVVKFSAYW